MSNELAPQMQQSLLASGSPKQAPLGAGQTAGRTLHPFHQLNRFQLNSLIPPTWVAVPFFPQNRCCFEYRQNSLRTLFRDALVADPHRIWNPPYEAVSPILKLHGECPLDTSCWRSEYPCTGGRLVRFMQLTAFKVFLARHPRLIIFIPDSGGIVVLQGIHNP